MLSEKEIKVNKELLDMLGKLNDVEAIRISDVLKSKDKFNFAAVYVIFSPTMELIYIGRTLTQTVRKRMRDHVGKSESSDLKRMIKNRVGYDQDASKYFIRYLEIENHRDRMRFESFIIAIHNPILNKEGINKKIVKNAKTNSTRNN
jgi:hypothetical protein